MLLQIIALTISEYQNSFLLLHYKVKTHYIQNKQIVQNYSVNQAEHADVT